MTDLEEVPPNCEFETGKLLLKFDAVIPSSIKVADDAVTKIAQSLTRGTSMIETSVSHTTGWSGFLDARAGGESVPLKSILMNVPR